MRVEIPTRYQKYAEIEAQTGQPRGFPTPTPKIEIYATCFASVGYAPLPVYHEPLESPVSRPEGAQEYPLVLRSFGWGSSAMSNTAISRACGARYLSLSWRSTLTRPQRRARKAFSQAVPLKTLVIFCYDPRAAEIPNAVAKLFDDEVYPILERLFSTAETA
jgi:hypothetical protein